jgi:hypothetical protein
MEIGYTIPELESARAIGRPVDSQKYKGMNLEYQMDIDERLLPPLLMSLRALQLQECHRRYKLAHQYPFDI